MPKKKTPAKRKAAAPAARQDAQITIRVDQSLITLAEDLAARIPLAGNKSAVIRAALKIGLDQLDDQN